jgi:cation:H+ antiporter
VNILISILITLAGVLLVLKGADKLTDGSVSLARRFAIPEFVIGLTVVAFGTSLPEFIVTLVASLKGSSDMGIGNVVGSNLFNTLMIVGVTAAIAPIAVPKNTIRKDIPFTILASVVLSAIALDRMFAQPGSTDVLTRGDGVALLGFFLVFLTYTFAISRPSSETSSSSECSSTSETEAELPGWKVALYIIGGLIGLIAGGELFVKGASDIAGTLGVSDAVIGLTLAAGGTSLPELATSIIAARKGQSGMAIGNVIGSNLFNIFWILGLCSCISPMQVGGVTVVDFALLVLSGVLFWLFAKTRHLIQRWEGVLLMAVYLGYITWLVLQSVAV